MGQHAKLRLAAVQAASVFLDREASVEKACRFIKEAGSQGADVIAFPEGFIPTHPNWYHYYSVSDARSIAWTEALFDHSLEIQSADFITLSRAVKEAGAYVVIGVCEKEPGKIGTMYNTLLFFDRNGELIGRHRKWLPTAGERLVHMPGSEDTIQAWKTDFGTLSGLICGENMHPLSIYTLIARGTRVHVACWPPHFARNQSMGDIILTITRAIAIQAKVFLINAIGIITDEIWDLMEVPSDQRIVWSEPEHGSTIIDPNGRIIAGPMIHEEGIIYADINLADAVGPKLKMDLQGHYSRNDLFDLRIKGVSIWEN